MDVELSSFMLKKYVNNKCKDLFYKEKLYKACNKSVFFYFSFSTETNLSQLTKFADAYGSIFHFWMLDFQTYLSGKRDSAFVVNFILVCSNRSVVVLSVHLLMTGAKWVVVNLRIAFYLTCWHRKSGFWAFFLDSQYVYSQYLQICGKHLDTIWRVIKILNDANVESCISWRVTFISYVILQKQCLINAAYYDQYLHKFYTCCSGIGISDC